MNLETAETILRHFFDNELCVQYTLERRERPVESIRLTSQANLRAFAERGNVEVVIQVADSYMLFDFCFGKLNQTSYALRLLNDFNSSADNPMYRAFIADGCFTLTYDAYCVHEDSFIGCLRIVFHYMTEDNTIRLLKPLVDLVN